MNNLGRDKVDWPQDVWTLIDQAVHDEAKQTKVAAQFLPIRPYPGAMTVPADTVDQQSMTVDQSAVTPLVEIWVEFALTAEQVAAEKDLHTAVTLATRATNLLSQGEDLLIFQGQDALNNDLFKNNKIRIRGGPAGDGLLKSAKETIPIKPVDEASRKYGENTFAAVAKAYADLQGQGQYGPYALVLPTAAYADTYAPLKDTLVTPADRIKPLMTAGLYGTGTLPGSNGAKPDASLEGVLVSLGGNTMDLVVGMDATTAFMQVDDQGLYRFRVFERFALRPKDRTAIVDLEFAAKAGAARSAAAAR
jgi:uncharacterized linocin/CFP29 family protein